MNELSSLSHPPLSTEELREQLRDLLECPELPGSPPQMSEGSCNIWAPDLNGGLGMEVAAIFSKQNTTTGEWTEDWFFNPVGADPAAKPFVNHEDKLDLRYETNQRLWQDLKDNNNYTHYARMVYSYLPTPSSGSTNTHSNVKFYKLLRDLDNAAPPEHVGYIMRVVLDTTTNAEDWIDYWALFGGTQAYQPPAQGKDVLVRLITDTAWSSINTVNGFISKVLTDHPLRWSAGTPIIGQYVVASFTVQAKTATSPASEPYPP